MWRRIHLFANIFGYSTLVLFIKIDRWLQLTTNELIIEYVHIFMVDYRIAIIYDYYGDFRVYRLFVSFGI